MEQVNGWLGQGGSAVAGLAALLHGGLVGGLAVLILVLTIAIKTAGPELREWVTMVWARKDAKTAELAQHDPARDEMQDAA